MDLNISSITLTVTNLNDSGEGSLRQVLADAQKQATDTITVNVVFDPSLAGTIILSSNLTVPPNVVVTLPDGVVINQQSSDIYVDGTLKAEYGTVTDVFVGHATSSYNSVYLYVQNGGVVELQNANIIFGGGYGQVYVYNGGNFRMTGGVMNAEDRGAYINAGGRMQLTGVEVKNKIQNYGELLLDDVNINSFINGNGSLDAKDCVIDDYVDAYGATILENVSCARLNVNSDTAISTKGEGVTLTEAQAIQLNGYSGTVATLLDSFEWAATAENAYIGITGKLNTATLSNVSEQLSGGYMLTGNVSVSSGHTVTLEDGVCINQQTYDLNIYGTLKAEYDTVTDVFVGHATSSYNSVYLYVQNGGVVELQNANVNLSGGYGHVYVYSGGSFRMTGGVMNVERNGANTQSGGVMQLTGVEVKNKIENQGSLVLEDVESSSYISGSGSLDAKDCVIADYVDAYGSTTLDNVSCSRLNVNSDTAISTKGEGVTLTGEQAILLNGYSGTVATLLDSFEWRATADNAYVGIAGTLGDSTFTALPESLAGGYRIGVGAVYVGAGKTVTLDKGVQWQIAGESAYSAAHLYISGTLLINNELESDALVGNNNYAVVHISNGGRLLLENANVRNLSGFYVSSGAALVMNGGVLDSQQALEISYGAMASLTDVEVNDYIVNKGTLEIEGGSISDYINSTGVLKMTDVITTSYIEALSTTELNGVTCGTLRVDSNTDVITGEKGVTLTSAEAICLTNYSGTVATLLDSFEWRATADNAYVGIAGTLGDSTFTALPGSLTGGYRIGIGAVYVGAGKTVTLDEGVQWQIAGESAYSAAHLYISGTLVINNELESDALIGNNNYAVVHISNGGRLLLENANVRNLSGFYVSSGAALVMNGGVLDSQQALDINSGATASLVNVAVYGAIRNGGSLVMDSCEMNNQSITTISGSSTSISNTSGISTLTINGGSAVSLVGNDFSSTIIKLNNVKDGEIIDLSGNYWGSSDLEVIKTKIQGYNENIVIINDVLEVDPTTAFMYLGNSLPQDQIGQGVTEIQFYFSHEIDASTVEEDRIRLVNNAGEVIDWKYVEVEGHQIRVGFAAFQKESTYRLELSSDILDIAGSALLPECEPGKGHDKIKVNLRAPRVSHMEPGGDFTGTLTNIILYFTEPMDMNTFKDAIQITRPDGYQIKILSIEYLGGSAYRVNCADQTVYGQYTVTVESTVTNHAGNFLNQNRNEQYGEAEDSYVGSFHIADVDLSITGVTVERNQTSGERISVSWTGANRTGYELKGSWTDGVYISKDGVWDIEDCYLGSVEHTGGLGSGEEYSGSLSAVMPSLVAGDYYVLVRTDINGQEAKDKENYEWVQNLGASPIAVFVRDLPLGIMVESTLSRDDRSDCYVVHRAPRMTVRVNFEGITEKESVDVYVCYGAAASTTNYDALYEISSSFNSFRLDADKTGRDAYLMVRRKDGAQVSYSVQVVDVSMEIDKIVSQNLNAAQECTFDIMGVNLKSGAKVVFLDSEGHEYCPDSIEYMSSNRIRVKFNAGVLPAGDLDVCITCGDDVAQVEKAVRLVNRAGSHFVMHVKQPNMLGFHLVSPFTISFENIGYEAMEAPLIFFSIERNGEEKAFLTMNEGIVTTGFWSATVPEGFTSSIAFLATGTIGSELNPTGRISNTDLIYELASMSTGSSAETHLGNFLSQSSSKEIENSQVIYYAGWQKPWFVSSKEPYYINVGYVSTDNTTEMDWSDIIPDMGEGFQLKEYIVRYLESQYGATWGAYVKHLNKQLRNLDASGSDISDVSVDSLLAHTIAQATGRISPVSVLASSTDIAVQSSGLSLQVSRVYSSDSYSHTQNSIFGYGWNHNWDIKLEIEESGDVVLNTAGAKIIFKPDYRGGYMCLLGEGYHLKENRNGTYTLTVGKGGEVVYEFGKSGQLNSVSEANGSRITCAYNATNQLVKLTHSNGEWIAYHYTEDGYVSKLIASSGFSSIFTYENGNLISSTDMLNDTINYSYSDSYDHFLTELTYADGTKKYFSYNENTLFEESWYEAYDSSGSRYNYKLDYRDDGGITVINQYGASSTYYYNLAGLVTKAVDVYGNALRYTYDRLGNLIAQTDQNGNVMSYTYDEDGNMTSVTNALGHTTSYHYTKDGLISRVIDANGNVTEYTYDAKGQATSITYADGSSEGWTYDRYGNALTWTTRSGKTVYMSYDSCGNMLSKEVENEDFVSYTYDSFGNILSSTDSGGTTTYTYDERFRVEKVLYPDGHSLRYTYDSRDLTTSVVDETGHGTFYSYNVWADLVNVTDEDGTSIVSYEYDEGGRLVKEVRGNNTSTLYSYNSSGDVTLIQHTGENGKVVSFCSYIYDKTGLRTSMETEYGHWSYGYDVLGQLIKADFTPSADSDIEEQHISYEYDAVGNRICTVINGIETIYTNNVLNQTVSVGDVQYEYDKDGNLIRKTDSSGVTTYRWSSNGLLLGMTTAAGDVYAYSYNANGERVSVSENGRVTTYMYDGTGNGNVWAEFDEEGNSRYYRYGNGLIGFESALEGEFWYESDSIGSVTGIRDAEGNQVASYAYNPFGANVYSFENVSNANTWLGLLGLRDDASGLTYMRTRYYDSQTGSFVSADPIGILGGLNLYAYCMNNPIFFVDPMGTSPETEKKVFGTRYTKPGDYLSVGLSLFGPSSTKLSKMEVGKKGATEFSLAFLDGAANAANVMHDAEKEGVNGKEYAKAVAYSSLEGITPINKWFIKEVAKGLRYNNPKISKGLNILVGGLDWLAASIGLIDAVDDVFTMGITGLKGKMTEETLSQLKTAGGRVAASIGDDITTGFLNWLNKDEKEELERRYREAMKRIEEEAMMCYSTNLVMSYDPNDIVGPTGYGEENYISAGQSMPFMVRFENEEDATAPARWIRVFTTLDEAYDLNSFTLDSIYLAGNTITMAEGQDSFNKIVTMTFEGQEVMVDIRINLDYDTRELKAEFMAIDPQSGSMLMDIMTGILYPNNDSGRGDGYFTYTVKLKDDLSTGTVVGNVADIYFDFNEVIPTPELNYTIDADAPGSRMLSAVDSGVGGEVVLTWEGADAEGGSGVAAYYIFVQKDGGEFGLWKTFTAETTTATFAGLQGSEYGFYVLSVDNVGNVEESKTEAEISAIPTTSDETAPDKLTNLYAAAQGSYAVYIWQGVDDPSGVYYVLEYADNADMTDAVQMYTLNPYLAIEGQELGTWYWRVKAVDGVGNESEWSEGQPYLHVSADPGADDKLASATQLVMGTTTVGTTTNVAPVADWVGAGDAVDYYSITAAGDGAYRVAVDTAALETAVQVSVGVLNAQGEFEAQQKLLLAPGAALGTLPGVAVEQGQTLYVKVEAVGGDQNTGGFYELSINGTVPSAGSGLATQNNRAEESTESAADGSATRGWVGAGDACDFYRVEMANAGSLNLALGELESGARVRIYEQREDGTLAQLQSIAVRSGSELDRTLNLTTGSYFVEVASLDNGAGMHNTAYSLTLKKEEEEQQNSSGLNLA